MGLILTRSPHFITGRGLDEGALLTLDIGYYNISGDYVVIKSYDFTINSTYGIDVSPFVSDYIKDNIKVLIVKTTVFGDINGVTQSPIVDEYVATEGYGYYEDGYNYDATSLLESRSFYAGSNRDIQVYSDGICNIPLLLPSDLDGTVTIRYKKGNDIVGFETVVLGAIYDEDTFLDTGFGSILTDGFGSEISVGDYTIGKNKYTQTRFISVTKDLVNLEIDSIDLASSYTTYSLNVEYISECKYEPNKVKFINKYGVLEDLWFFKKSKESISTEKTQFNQFILDSYIYGVKSNHSFKNFNVNGKEKVTMNTGFVPDSFSENFRQLMLSEYVYVESGNDLLPLNITDSSLEYKKHINNKLINYTVQFEYAYNKINNIV